MTKTRDEPSIAATTVYTAVSAEPDEREYELTATPVDMSGLYVDRPVRTMDERYSDLVAGRRKLTWTDTFFDDDEDVIAVFDFDYEAMESFYTSVGWVAFGSTLLYTPFFMLSLFAMVPCYLRQNIRWGARSQHVAITRDGIRFVRDKRRCCWGMPCTDQGKSSKTVPFDKITDCDVEEPAGNSCLCIPNVLTTLNVDTASSGQDGQKELRLAGLKDPHSFKKLVWAMKRSQQGVAPSGFAIGGANARGAYPAVAATASALPADDVATLLREIRDELRTNNELLKSHTAAAAPTAADPPNFSIGEDGSGVV